jgi:DNA-binding NtrC family response regulator
MIEQSTQKILIVDDEPEICWIVKKVLSEKGYEVHTAFDGERGLEMVDSILPDLVLLDLKLPGINGLETLERIKERYAKLPVIILSAFDDVSAAVRGMKLGAYDYISKPLNVDEMLITLKNALKTSQLLSEVDNLKSQIAKQGYEPMVWSSTGMQKVMELVDRIAHYDVTALIRGESGTGKELIAEYLHNHSPRANQPLISIDCSALPETLVESELFGYERGAFTGAHESKAGRFEMAQNGTLFLDEIGNLPLATQIKLLRVLQERCLVRLSGKREIAIDVRIITATNINLEEAMQAGRFREDLYHRLNEFTIHLPPLRERGEEVELLAKHFLERFAKEFGKDIKSFTPEVYELMRRYSWPGNVRELMNVVKRAVVMATDVIDTTHFPVEVAKPAAGPLEGKVPDVAPIRPLKEICQEVSRRVEREAILRALQETRWNKLKTARLLKINYKTLFNKMKELGI